MRPYLPFMAVLVLFGAVACGGSSSPSSSSASSAASHKPTVAEQAAATNKAACKQIASYPAYTDKASALKYISFLEGLTNKAGIDTTLSGDMMTLSTVLSGHEDGTKGLTTAKVDTAAAALTKACQKFTG